MSAFTQRIAAYLALGTIAAALLFYGFGRLDALFGRQDAAITDSSQARIARHAGLVRLRDSLAHAEAALTATTRAEVSTVAQLRAALASGKRVDTVTVLQEIVVHDSVALSACQRSVLVCEARARSAEAESDSLTRQLARQVTVKSHRCGLFVGGGVGTAGKVEALAGVGCRVWP